jgi:hypothetical protein
MPTKTITPWEFGAYVTEPVRTTISALLWALHHDGGTIRSESGRVGAALRDRAVELGMFVHPRYQATSKTASGGISSLLASLEMDTYGTEAIEREKNGTRSFEIRLLLKDEEMPPKPVMVKRTLGDSTKPQTNPVDVSARSVDVVEHVEVEDLEDGWDDIDAPDMAPATIDTADISSFPEIIIVSDTPGPYGLVLEAQRSVTRALVTLARETPPPADHTELIALRRRVQVLTDDLAATKAERDRLTEILTTITAADASSTNGAAS